MRCQIPLVFAAMLTVSSCSKPVGPSDDLQAAARDVDASRIEQAPDARQSEPLDPGADDATVEDVRALDEAGTQTADSAQVEASLDGAADPDAPLPCQDGSASERCERVFCGNTTIVSDDTLDAARVCAEIHGNLHIATTGFSEVTASDLPYLTRVTGDLIVSGFVGNVANPRLQSLTLAGLESVDGRLIVGEGTLEELYFPSLKTVGTVDGADGALQVGYIAGLRIVDLPALIEVHGDVIVASLSDLCSFGLGPIARVGGAVTLVGVPQVPASAFRPLTSAATEQVTQQFVGCCSTDGVSCENFTASNGDAYCGCSTGP